MDEYKKKNQDLSAILKACSDTTRRSLLTQLVQNGPTRVTDLAAQYGQSLNTISKHIKVLETAGLVTRKTMGRVHMIEAELGPVTQIDTWFKELRSIWDIRLDALNDIFKE